MQTFQDLIEQYQYFLLDAYGVFWGSSKVGLLPGAEEAMRELVCRGKDVGILSNSTQLADKEKAKLAKHGLEQGTHYHFLLTSGELTRQLLLSAKLPFPTPRKQYFLFGGEHPRFSSPTVLFEGSAYTRTEQLDEADFIYLSIPHIDGVDQEDPSVFTEQVRPIAEKKIPVLCANPDLYAHEGAPPRLVVRQGSIARLFESLGAPVSFIGKPYSTVFEKALEYFPSERKTEDILMVGDTPETDVRGARQLGIASALVTETGVMKERTKGRDLASALQDLAQSDQAQHFIPALKL